MNTHSSHRDWSLAAIGGLIAWAFVAPAHGTTVTEQVEPAQIDLGQSAQLTITASGDSQAVLAPPVIPGLEFVAVGQSTQMESINGQTTTNSSVIYRVTPQRAGIYTIPSVAQGSQPQVLRVLPAGASRGVGLPTGAAPGGPLPAAALPTTDRLMPDGSAFVRLRVPKHQLYVGESVPVDIQVGMRAGLVASLNGLPTLNGDSFTLNKLSTQPDRTDEVIGGQPFTVLTWHGVLAAVKPGALSLRIETPLTVRLQTRAAVPTGGFADSDLNDFFNSPLLQNFFGATTEKDVTIASTPAQFNVLALPIQNRPEGFSGAVGTFKVSSELSNPTMTVGDPVTLRLQVSGAGNFDRVHSSMLAGDDRWKTYAPTSTFTAADDAGYHGRKVFEQPLIAQQAGNQTVPGIVFSYFDPETGQYQTAHTAPLTVAVSPAAAGSAATVAPTPIGGAVPTAVGALPLDGLRPDHVDTGASSSSLVPLLFKPRYLSIPVILSVAFAGTWLWLRRRARRSSNDEVQSAPRACATALLDKMDRAAATGDAPAFLDGARNAVRQALAARWQVSPESITPASMDSRLGPDRTDILRLFELADQAAYSGALPESLEPAKWRRLVERQIEEVAPS